jgi:hypothetical protein
LGQTSPNLTADGFSPIRAGIFTSIHLAKLPLSNYWNELIILRVV